jgi:chromosome segregation ATPase
LKSSIKTTQDSVLPLQRETHRLTKENNALHLELMKVKENSDAREDQWRATVKRLEGENSDLKFLIEKLKRDLKKSESANLKLRTQCDNAMSKAYLPSSHKGLEPHPLNTDNLIGRTQDFDLPRPLKPNEKQAAHATGTQIGWENEIRKAEERATRVQEELDNLSRSKLALEDEISHMRKQVQNRDREIERLTDALGEKISVETIARKHKLDSTEEAMKYMNERIDYLNSENVRLETELAKARTQLNKVSGVLQDNDTLQGAVNELRNKNSVLISKLRELEEVSRELDKPRAPPEELASLRLKNEELQNQLHTFKLELNRSKDDLRRTGQIQAAYNSDKRAFGETIDKLSKEKEKQYKELGDTKTLNKKLEHDLQLSGEELKFTQNQLQNLKKEVEFNKTNLSRMNQEQVSTTEEVYNLKTKIAGLESANSLVENSLSNLKYELERVNKLKSAAEDALEALRNDILKYKNESESTQSGKQRIQLLYESTQKELEAVREENRNLAKLREDDRRSIYELEYTSRDTSAKLTAANERIKSLQRELQLLTEDLNTRGEDLRKSESRSWELERELSELRPLKDKYSVCREELQRLQAIQTDKEHEEYRRNIEVGKLHNTIQDRDKEINDLKTIIEDVKSSQSDLRRELDRTQKEESFLRSSASRVYHLEADIKDLKEQIRMLRESEFSLQRKNDILSTECEKLKESLDIANRQLERYTQEKASNEKEIENLRKNLLIYENSENDLRREAIRNEDARRLREKELEDMKKLTSGLNEKLEEAREQASFYHKNYETEKIHTNKLLEQQDHLKKFISDIEASRDELMARLSRRESEQVAVEDERKELMVTISKLRSRLGSIEDDARETSEFVKSLRRENEGLENKLQAKVFELEDYKKSLRSEKERSASLEELLMNERQKYDDYFESTKHDLKLASRKCEELESELRESKAAVAYDRRDSDDKINRLSKEIYSLKSEIDKQAGEKERLQSYNESMAKNEKLAQQLCRSAEKERDEIKAEFSQLSVDYKNLTEAYRSARDELEDISKRYREAEYEASRIKDRVRQNDQTVDKYTSEITSLQKEVGTLTSKLRQSEERLKEAEEDYARSFRDMSMYKHSIREFDSQKEEHQRQLNSLESERLLLEGRVRSLESDFTSIKSELDYEKQRAKDLERVIERERQNVSKLQQELGRADDDRTRLRNEISRLELSGSGGLSRKVEELRTENLNLEMELRKSRDELSRCQHQLSRTENRLRELDWKS